MTKLAGFLVGAGVAAVAVWGFKTWWHVSDDDLLAQAVRDHCMPYSLNATAPFVGLGRTPGVFDDVFLPDGARDGGVAIIFDDRFVAKWSVWDTEDGHTLRQCSIQGTPGSGAQAVFTVQENGFVPRYTDIIASVAPLEPTDQTVNGETDLMTWRTADTAPYEGSEVLIVGNSGFVTFASVATFLP